MSKALYPMANYSVKRNEQKLQTMPKMGGFQFDCSLTATPFYFYVVLY